MLRHVGAYSFSIFLLVMKIKASIPILISIMTFALLGMIVLQFYWVDNALLVQEKYFDQAVTRALNESTKKIEGKYASFLIQHHHDKPNSIDSTEVDSSKLTNKREKQTGIRTWKYLRRKIMRKTSFENLYDHEYDLRLVDNQSKNILLYNISKSSGNKLNNPDLLFKLFDSLASNISTFQIFQNLLMELVETMPISTFLKEEDVQEILHQELQKQDIQASFEFGIFNRSAFGFEQISNPHYRNPLYLSEYQFAMFGEKLNAKSKILSVYFPNKNNFLFKRMALVLACSAFLLLLIIACFSYTVLTIIKQKKLSDLKTDFINNMTHEFKTPVSTILLASEALLEKDAATKPERLKKLVEVIKYENDRIGMHVERVLQLAAMEKGNVRFNATNINVKALLNEVIKGIIIQVENKAGSISCRFAPGEHFVNADQLHLSNAINNLIDNAIKYSDAAPSILIRTYIDKDKIAIAVQDKGIGLTKEQQQKVFDQFYRVPTGNLHNIKGFGLGLHYVKMVAEMHNGSVEIISELGKGSTFILKIPFETHI